MLKPSTDERMQGTTGNYGFVVGIAKRARQLTEEIEEKGEIVTEKPVSMAVEEYFNGELAIEADGEEMMVEVEPEPAAEPETEDEAETEGEVETESEPEPDEQQEAAE